MKKLHKAKIILSAINFALTYLLLNVFTPCVKKRWGLLGNAKGAAKPIPFVEDTCVPPEHLADYIAEFRTLLDSHNLQYGMFGHVDAGVLHVRPALDLCDKEQVKLFKQISDEVAELTVKYGGLLWGGTRQRCTFSLWGEILYSRTLGRIALCEVLI